MRNLQTLVKSILVTTLIFLGVVLTATIFPLANLVPLGKATPLLDGIRIAWCKAMLRVLNVHLDVKGIVAKSPRLLVSNHVSWLDIIVLCSQRAVTFVAKNEVMAWPIIGFMARQTGTLFMRRGFSQQSNQIIQAMAWRLRQGRTIALFPEGTTTNGETVGHFHPRMYQAAILARTPVQAVAIQYHGDARQAVPFIGEDEFLPHLIGLLKHRRIDASVTFCAEIEFSAKGRNFLAQQSRAQIYSTIFPDHEADNSRHHA